ESLMIRTPIVNHVSLPLIQGERMIVRFFIGTRAFAFECWVERAFAGPLYYLHVSFPQKIIGTDVRKAIRVGVDITARVSGGAGDESARIVDISTQGALLECARELGKPEDRLKLGFGFRVGEDGRDAKLELGCVIKNVRRRAEGTAGAPFLVGV